MRGGGTHHALHCTTKAQAPGWDGQQWVAGAHPQHVLPCMGRAEGEHCLASVAYFWVDKWKDVVDVQVFYLSEISVLCQGWVRPVMVLSITRRLLLPL